MIKIKNFSILNFLCFVLLSVITIPFINVKPAFAQCCFSCSCSQCSSRVGSCSSSCACTSTNQTGQPSDPATTLGHITRNFVDHQTWLTDVVFRDSAPNDIPGILAAMQLMTIQLTTVGMQQVQAVGMFFDAKHQLETQRIFQTMVARAHKDYHPSQELCEVGTTVRSLSGSDRIADLTSVALAKRNLDVQMLSADAITIAGAVSSKPSRLVQFIQDYCNPEDNGRNLNLLCLKGNNNPLLFNRDINYTRSLSSPLTLDIDLTATDPTNSSDDEKALMALMNNLFGHESFEKIADNDLVTDDNTELKKAGYEALMDSRALTAKRSVAVNSFVSIAGLKSKGTQAVQPFIYAALQELGNNLTPAQIREILGDRPSYHAQMEFLTKIANQSTSTVEDLIDKPANVSRKETALLAIELMQKWDTYRSLLRSEAIISTMLETALMEEQDLIANEVGNPKVRK